jgi:hypothetical protein
MEKGGIKYQAKPFFDHVFLAPTSVYIGYLTIPLYISFLDVQYRGYRQNIAVAILIQFGIYLNNNYALDRHNDNKYLFTSSLVVSSTPNYLDSSANSSN